VFTLRLFRALTRNRAVTSPAADDPRLRGRRYAVPFQVVWEHARALVDGGLTGWTLVEADDQAGRLQAETRSRLFRFVDDVVLRIGLDEEGQTRLDAVSASRVGRADLGQNARNIHRLCRALDRTLSEEGWPVTPP
jgi:uncharacterized protein (DUF1499 family)